MEKQRIQDKEKTAEGLAPAVSFTTVKFELMLSGVVPGFILTCGTHVVNNSRLSLVRMIDKRERSRSAEMTLGFLRDELKM